MPTRRLEDQWRVRVLFPVQVPKGFIASPVAEEHRANLCGRPPDHRLRRSGQNLFRQDFDCVRLSQPSNQRAQHLGCNELGGPEPDLALRMNYIVNRDERTAIRIAAVGAFTVDEQRFVQLEFLTPSDVDVGLHRKFP